MGKLSGGAKGVAVQRVLGRSGNGSIPYLLVYKSTPPFSRSKMEFLIISGKTNEIHTNRNFPKCQSFLSENVLKTR